MTKENIMNQYFWDYGTDIPYCCDFDYIKMHKEKLSTLLEYISKIWIYAGSPKPFIIRCGFEAYNTIKEALLSKNYKDVSSDFELYHDKSMDQEECHVAYMGNVKLGVNNRNIKYIYNNPFTPNHLLSIAKTIENDIFNNDFESAKSHIDILSKSIECKSNNTESETEIIIKNLGDAAFAIQNSIPVHFIRYIKDIKDTGISSEIGVTIMKWDSNISKQKYLSYIEAFDYAVKYILALKSPPIQVKQLNMDTIATISNKIAENTHRGCGDFIIANSENIQEIITEHNNHFRYDVPYDLDCNHIGRYSLIRYPIGNSIIMGYKGVRDNDSGIIFHEHENTYLPITNMYDTESYYEVFQKECK